MQPLSIPILVKCSRNRQCLVSIPTAISIHFLSTFKSSLDLCEHGLLMNVMEWDIPLGSL